MENELERNKKAPGTASQKVVTLSRGEGIDGDLHLSHGSREEKHSGWFEEIQEVEPRQYGQVLSGQLDVG